MLAFTSAIPAGIGFPDSFDAVRAHAERTELKNFLTSTLRRLDSLDSDCAAERTCDDADPVSAAASFHRPLNVAGDLLRRRALPFRRRRDRSEEISDKLALRSAHKPKRVGEKLRSAEIA